MTTSLLNKDKPREKPLETGPSLRPESTLKIVSAQLAAAAEADDLAAIDRALAARAQALKNLPRQADPIAAHDLLAAYKSGELALAALSDLKRHLQAEHSRLAQLRAFSRLSGAN